jgi:phage tail-like protein
MATERSNPYGAFNFLVTATPFGNTGTIYAGFQEISGLSIEVTVAEYRNGNDKQNYTRKMNGLAKVGDITLKRGLIGKTDFFEWIKQTIDGVQTVRINVKIELLDEAHTSTPVMTWILTNARPMKYSGPSLNAKSGTDVAIEELVLSCERMEIE